MQLVTSLQIQGARTLDVQYVQYRVFRYIDVRIIDVEGLAVQIQVEGIDNSQCSFCRNVRIYHICQQGQCSVPGIKNRIVRSQEGRVVAGLSIDFRRGHELCAADRADGSLFRSAVGVRVVLIVGIGGAVVGFVHPVLLVRTQPGIAVGAQVLDPNQRAPVSIQQIGHLAALELVCGHGGGAFEAVGFGRCLVVAVGEGAIITSTDRASITCARYSSDAIAAGDAASRN